MPEVIQEWLGTRLGVLIEMTPQTFGRNTKDGRILAKLLYTYGVIPRHVLDQIEESKNYHKCYENLILLKPWLDFIGVTHDKTMLQKMAGGEGSAAISVFYSVYLNLERRDRLHFISAQKERRFSSESCHNRFKVDWVPEMELRKSSEEADSKLAMPLIEKRDIIDYHRQKCKEVIEIIKNTKEKFRKTINRKQKKLGPVISRHATHQPIDKRLLEAEETKETIKEFEKKHPQESPNLTYSELIELKNMQDAQPFLESRNLEEAKNIICGIRQRKRGEIYARNFNEKMQEMVLDEQWKIIIDKQDKNFDDTVYTNLLKQSQYEKQMASKLYMMRNLKRVFSENRKKVECLKIEQRDKDFDNLVTEEMELKGEYWEEEEFEKERIAELHRRLYDEKITRRRAMIREECRKIFNSWVDIAIRVSEVRQLTSCQVPKSFMKDMKELFFKDLSIFDLLDNFEELFQPASPTVIMEENEEEGEGEGEEMFFRDEEYEKLKSEEAERQSVLNDCDFNDYISLLGPWMVELFFPDGSETEVRHAVVGYIVHKLLEIKYPSPNTPAPVAIRPLKPAAIVQGLTDETAIKMLTELMEACKILVVRVDDAINFVLASYKEELSVVRDIDINFQKATANALKDKTANGKEKEVKKKVQLLKKEEPEKPFLLENETNLLDKETQTPRMIPEDDPLLSPNASVGKMAFEALGAGDPVPDPVIVSALVAYVVSKQDEYEGWILLNYPLLYSQASDLECALTGYRILPMIEDMECLEDVEEFTFRELCGDPFATDEFADRRISRIVPKPEITLTQIESPKSYFDSFIKVTKSSESPRKKSPEDEFLPIEKFYLEQDILFNFEYLNLNFQSVKSLGKAILSATEQDKNNLEPKSSLEIFGNIVLELSEKYETSKKKAVKETAPKKPIKETITFESAVVPEEISAEDKKSIDKKQSEPPPAAKPGDPDWEWATGTQPESILTALASLWECMEAVYVEDFKDVFFSLRVHRSNVLSYSFFIKKSVRTLMRRPDDKQKLLGQFQQMFNEIDEDLRPDVDIKCELHVRVSELEQALMEIADERKINSLKDLKKVGQNGWVPDEMATLVNAYITALQLEADRCIDTCQVIMDYYISLQQRVPEEKPLTKVIVPKIEIKERKYSVISSPSNKSSFHTPRNSDAKRSNKSILELTSKLNHERTSKTRSWTERRKRSSEVSFLTGAGDVITEILVNLTLPEDGLTPFHNFFMDSVDNVVNEVKATAESCILEAKKGEKAPQKNLKKTSDTKVSFGGNVTLEWTTALENELSRFLFRMKLILARGIMEMNEFLTTILNNLSSLTEDINEMYLKEIQSISECCKVFRCAVEEEIAIQPQLELREDEFVVNNDVLLFPNQVEKAPATVEDDQRKSKFTIEQLSILFQKLQTVAPDGEIIKRSLVYILEDLRVLKGAVECGSCFPDIWSQLEPDEMVYLMNEIYQNLEIVHWKDFIIYAMELPVPTEADILLMRKRFREHDPLVTELVTRENYDCINFWFEDHLNFYSKTERNEAVKDLLYKMYQVNEQQTNYSAILLAFCKDENPFVGFTKALALAMGKKIIVKEVTEDLQSVEGEGGRSSDYNFFDESNKSNEKKLDCCPTSSTEITRKCIPKEKMVRCECKDVEKSVTTEEEEETDEDDRIAQLEINYSAEEGSAYYYGPSEPSSETSEIPYNILNSLLKASYPSLQQLSILLDCKQTFQETLNSVYDSLESHNNTIEVHKLFHHTFIFRLLQTTNKFKFVKIQKVLSSITEFKNSGARNSCYPDNLNFNVCLN